MTGLNSKAPVKPGEVQEISLDLGSDGISILPNFSISKCCSVSFMIHKLEMDGKNVIHQSVHGAFFDYPFLFALFEKKIKFVVQYENTSQAPLMFYGLLMVHDAGIEPGPLSHSDALRSGAFRSLQ